ncbi:hypothetical protein [Catenovulum maritimum]|uniref:hypothetical protein n=1 Tax=Catenovulum maritimum TaxID=1513271 RepID=UPI00065FA0CE|nr:hypothetical protein [Catenovulum maritimum]
MKYIFKLIKLTFWLFVLSLLAVGYAIYLIRSDVAVVAEVDKVDASRIEQAKVSLRDVAHQINNSVGAVNFYFSQGDIDAISAVASYTVPLTKFRSNVTEHGFSLSATTEIKTPKLTQYINLKCILLPKGEKLAIDYCSLGELVLPNWLVEWGITQAITHYFKGEVANNILGLVQTAKVSSKGLNITLLLSDNLKSEVISAIQQNSPINALTGQVADLQISPELVATYMSELNQIEQLNLSSRDKKSLPFFIGKAFQLAKIRSQDNDPTLENQAALWALAISYGSRRFGHLIGVPRVELDKLSNARLQIEGRGDLPLHFLFSAVLERLMRQEMGLKIGELKELLDTNKGGSGFSFPDLAADKAGLAFARYVLEQPRQAQNRLANITDGIVFFPMIHDLPEGLPEATFKKVYGDTESSKYKLLERRIDMRIAELPLYQ